MVTRIKCKFHVCITDVNTKDVNTLGVKTLDVNTLGQYILDVIFWM